MSPLGTLQTALSSIGANRLRAGLALLGIVIGVTAVISLMSIGRGAQEAITSRIESLGTNLLFVQPGASTQGGVSGALGSAGTLTLEDATALVDPVYAPSVAAVAPEIRTQAQVVAGNRERAPADRRSQRGRPEGDPKPPLDELYHLEVMFYVFVGVWVVGLSLVPHFAKGG